MKTLLSVRTGIVAIAIMAALAVPAQAADQYIFGFSGSNAGNHLTLDGTTDLGFLDQGWYFQSGSHTPSNPNYIVGICDTNCALKGEYRNWFAFDISSLTAPVSSLSLRLFSYNVTLSSGNYYLNDYTGSVPSLIAGTAGVAGFNDLGGGQNYGFRFYQDTESNTFHTISLNSNAVNSLNAAIRNGDDRWAIGGAFLAGTVPIPPAVPEPASFLLLAIGVGGLIARRRA